MWRFSLTATATAAVVAAAVSTLAQAAWPSGQSPAPAQSAAPASDLDDLMARASAHRDQNWKKLDQYVLDEREDVEVRGPGDSLVLGDHREYTWFIRDGFFVRSPVKANGVSVSEPDRIAYEQRWLQQERGRQAARDRRAANGNGANPGNAPNPAASPQSNSATADGTQTDAPTAPAGQPPPENAGDFLRQTREPRFVSAGYFLEFQFEPGNYFLAGRETINGRQLLKVEYYPTNLFDDRRNRRMQNRDQDRNQRQEELRRQMNKTSLVTLWVDPTSAEIVRYTFNNLGLDFLPGGWLVRFEDMQATVNMVEPFPGVWLPGSVNVKLTGSLAPGRYALQYNLTYENYKQASVKATIRPPQ
jgi:hypothetical protein